jgi:hypothetical protein
VPRGQECATPSFLRGIPHANDTDNRRQFGHRAAAAVELARRGERVFASMRNPAHSGALRTALDDAGVEAEVIQLT